MPVRMSNSMKQVSRREVLTRLAVFDLTEKKKMAIHPTGSDPDEVGSKI